tara:strand:+ start:11779 stop:12378 length:600 start_codon:yes stop_codon:yes gene_type:complete
MKPIGIAEKKISPGSTIPSAHGSKVSMIAIVLNGTSSSGKSSIARSIQKLSAQPVLHASLDTFTDMFDWTSISEEEKCACHSVGVSNFHKSLPVLASSKYSLVIDHVFERMDWFRDCFAALTGIQTLFVGVHCPLHVLEARERKRGDRRIGLAKIQFDRVHEKKVYDLELDTSLMSSDRCAGTILERISTQAGSATGLH